MLTTIIYIAHVHIYRIMRVADFIPGKLSHLNADPGDRFVLCSLLFSPGEANRARTW